MKKKLTITAVVIICILLGVAVALSANRAGGEIGFEATINSVENGVAYATVNKQDAGFLAPKLPGNIEFNTSDLDVTLQAGDEISGCYLSGTIVLGLILFFIGGFMGVGAFFASTTKEN